MTLILAPSVNANATNDVEADRARELLCRRHLHSRRDASISVANATVIYTAQVGVGSLATECEFIHHLKSGLFRHSTC